MSSESFEKSSAQTQSPGSERESEYSSGSTVRTGIDIWGDEEPWDEREDPYLTADPAVEEAGLPEETEDWPDSDLLSDEFVYNMLLNATVLRSNRMLADIEERLDDPLRIEPTLHLSPFDQPFLRFRVGTKKLYLVKNILDFINAYSTCSAYEFSQKYSDVPSREAFDPQSLSMLDFMVRHYRSSSLSRDYNTQRLQLTNAVIDEFFSLLCEGCELNIAADGYSGIQNGQYIIRKRNIPLHYVLQPAEGGVNLMRISEYQVIKGRQGPYLVVDDTVYCPSLDFQQRCGYIVTRMAQLRKPAFVSYRDLPTFMINVVRETDDYLSFDIGQFHRRFQNTQLHTTIKFDMAGDSGIKAHMSFCYGKRTHDAFGKKDLSKAIDYAAERRAERLLIRYMGNRILRPGTLLLPNDDDKIYELISRGVAELNEVAEVYASEDFKKLKVRKKAVVNVGVHIEGDLLAIQFDPEGLDYDELADVLRNFNPTKKYWRLRDGSYLSLENNSISQLVDFTEGLDLSDKDIASGMVYVSVNKAPFVDNALKKNADIRYERDDSFRNIIRNLRDVADADFVLPHGMTDVMRNYQKTGFRWLKTIDNLHFGGILADDMGLGKTLQTLAFIESERDSSGNRQPSLVVSQASVVLNWQAEAARFTPHLKTVALIGAKENREMILQDADEYDLIVTSYGLLLRDIETWENISFRCIVLDEAQYIKNQTTQSARAVKRLNGTVRFALTGTPVENSLAELWSIFDFIMPGYLRNYGHFSRKYEKPIVCHHDERAAERLRGLVRPFILRRLKKDVLLELPEKTEQVLLAEMTEEQRKLYLATMAEVVGELREKSADATEGVMRISILSALTRLRQICCDPCLLFSDYEGGSAKLDACMELVQNSIESGHRLLLFSQFTSMIQIIQERLNQAGIPYYRLDGSTPKEERQQLMNVFNSGDTPVFLISLRAGGTGLNLTGADVVIHYDPWWNISVQNQASDRAHRIGQVNNVQVFKLIARDTIEERILRLQEKKKQLADNIVQGGGNVFESMSSDELMQLFAE